jgi:hypothetical protein
MNWKGFGEQYCLIMNYFPIICLDGLKKSTKTFARIVTLWLTVEAEICLKRLSTTKIAYVTTRTGHCLHNFL